MYIYQTLENNGFIPTDRAPHSVLQLEQPLVINEYPANHNNHAMTCRLARGVSG